MSRQSLSSSGVPVATLHRGFSEFLALAFWLSIQCFGFGAPPQVLVDGLRLDKIATEPDVMTPIGLTCLENDVVVVNSHTHQRSNDYVGPASDEIRRLRDSDGDGHYDQWSTIATGLHQTMNVLAAPKGGLYIVTRRDVHLLQHEDLQKPPWDASRSDRVIVRLESPGDYPHNGLSGITLTHDDRLLLGLGENLGAEYRLIGADGSQISDRGGCGTIFVGTPEGKNIQRYATGFWNPFSICEAFGKLFTVDNDPDASPPCRLIHVVESGDYGHRWEYGRAGIHPLQAWDGELPGTLPMVCGTSEAPTAVLMHRGYLWVTSWGEHCIERYELYQRGGSFGAKRQVVVQGDHTFRPTGMTIGSDGSLYFGDWVSQSYPVHGQGKIWRLGVEDAELPMPTTVALAPIDAKNSQDRDKDRSDLIAPDSLRHNDPFVRQQGVAACSKLLPNQTPSPPDLLNPSVRLAMLQARRWTRRPIAIADLRQALRDSDANVRLYAVRWIADEQISELQPDVTQLLDGEIPNERYYLTVLGAIDWLGGSKEPRNSQINDALLRRELANPRRSATLRAIALRTISPHHPWLTIDVLTSYLRSPDPGLRLEAVRTLAYEPSPERLALLAEFAQEPTKHDPILQSNAMVGLSSAIGQYRDLLVTLSSSPDPTVQQTAVRILRLTRPTYDVSPSNNATNEFHDLAARVFSQPGDAVVGSQLFMMSVATRCIHCHQHRGRGGKIGPDLTHVGTSQSKERILESILQPSKEVAPRYQAWVLQTSDGRTLTGLRLARGGDNGEEAYVDTQGKQFMIPSQQIELRKPASVSIMPDGLHRQLDVSDLRDIVAFLTAE
ncbi:MAG: c-type cytochrome [Planctomycetota bacterium]|nr:c-type cytochrome [Planctomycetota bacterium]MDA1178680.1 c-type cytochrome [Planctomycetota bacterium]